MCFLVKGLSTLEYRGYDSAGLALISSEGASGLQRARSKGRVAEFAAKVKQEGMRGSVGIAHTRWATHGVPAERNTHPHISAGLAVVHNGIIENNEALREQLQGLGYAFTSDTDTETIAHLIQACFKGQIGEPAENLFSAVQCAVAHSKGAFALAVISEEEPECVVVAREGSPLMLGVAEDAHYAASDASALLSVAKRMMYLENGNIARLTPGVDYLGRSVRSACAAPSHNVEPKRECGRAGGLQPLHAEGNLRAAPGVK